MNELLNLLKKSYTPYHAVAQAGEILKANGYQKLSETETWALAEGGKYFTVRDGSALIAFNLPKNCGYAFSIIASHTDSPCLKIKLNGETASAGCTRVSVEKYGGGLNYSLLDIPLNLAGRAVVKTQDGVKIKLIKLEEKFVIPSLAIHYNRTANDGVKLNPQIDLQAITGLGGAGGLLSAVQNAAGGEVLDYDLFLTCAQEPFYAGLENKLVCAPRVDNLTSVFSSLKALLACEAKTVPVVYFADNEEVGSRTKQGAGSTFLKDVLKRISLSLGKNKEEHYVALNKSFMVSCDNAHATHPNHPELADGSNPCVLGGGIVIKHHANQNYTTDALSSAALKAIFDNNGVNRQDFFMRSDLPCGGTLGAISSSQLSIRAVDIGIPQLAMHSATETFATADYSAMVNGLTCFFNAGVVCTEDGVSIK